MEGRRSERRAAEPELELEQASSAVPVVRRLGRGRKRIVLQVGQVRRRMVLVLGELEKQGKVAQIRLLSP